MVILQCCKLVVVESPQIIAYNHPPNKKARRVLSYLPGFLITDN